MDFNSILASLNSIASFIAITAALFGWYRSAQRALVIDRVVIHRSQESCNYIIVIKNRKPYPVTIKSANCYTKQTFKIEKQTDKKPEYYALLILNNSLFQDRTAFEIAPSGHTDIRIKGSRFPGDVQELLFSMHTSHGYHEIWCKDVRIVEVAAQNIGQIDYTHNYESKVIAKIMYMYFYVKYLFTEKCLQLSTARRANARGWLQTFGGSMTEPPRYPKDDEVKVEWKALHIAIIVLSVVLIWPLFLCATDISKSLPQKFLSIAGLNVDIIGVVIASLKTPYYGSFRDGGKIEVTRANIERKYFQFGMWLIALGFLLQALGTLP